MRMTTAAALCLAASLYPDISENLQAGERSVDSVHLQRDTEQFITRATLTAEDGRVAWSDVVRAVVRAQGYDDRALNDTLRLSSMDRWKMKLDGRTAAITLLTARRLLGDGVSLAIVPAASAQSEPRLVIELDHQALLASQRKVKQQLRDTLLPEGYNGREFGIRVHEKSMAASESDHLVIFIHGLNAHPSTVGRLCTMAQRNGLACAEFNYPNDQAIETSGRLLAAELARWKKIRPRQRVSLVTHSMGGLVARVAIEDPQLDPGNVDRLIMVAPPNQGCELAQFAFGLDLWEYMDGRELRDKRCIFYSSIEDGLSEATVDLEPNSIFLTKLNRRQRNANVRYSIFLGTGAPCSQRELDNVRGYITNAGERCSWAKFFTSRIEPSLADMDEVIKGKGDGAVAVKRGRLDGVQDTNILGFSHLNVLHDTNDPHVKEVYAEVLKRLKET